MGFLFRFRYHSILNLSLFPCHSILVNCRPSGKKHNYFASLFLRTKNFGYAKNIATYTAPQQKMTDVEEADTSLICNDFEPVGTLLSEITQNATVGRYKISIIPLAAGVQAGTWLLQTPGASSALLESVNPYARESTQRLIRDAGVHFPESAKFASAEAAEALALTAEKRY